MRDYILIVLRHDRIDLLSICSWAALGHIALSTCGKPWNISKIQHFQIV